MSEVPIRDAATVIVVRDRARAPRLLMGRRASGAVFMPGKFVFPGGAVDPCDAEVPLYRPLPEPCAGRIGALADAVAAAGIRELWEETGLILGVRAPWPGPVPADWAGFATQGHRPDAGVLQYIFRAVTPAGRPRRFDARFLLADAADIAGDPDDFPTASEELTRLQWVPLADVGGLDLAPVTEIVLSEIGARLHEASPPEAVPCLDGRDRRQRS